MITEIVCTFALTGIVSWFYLIYKQTNYLQRELTKLQKEFYSLYDILDPPDYDEWDHQRVEKQWQTESMEEFYSRLGFPDYTNKSQSDKLVPPQEDYMTEVINAKKIIDEIRTKTKQTKKAKQPKDFDLEAYEELGYQAAEEACGKKPH